MMIEPLPFSQASENNKQPILDVLQPRINSGTVLEIGTGTAQHAVFFAEHLPNVIWQCADQLAYHDTIERRVNDSNLHNIHQPIALEAISFDWLSVQFDHVFTANTAHIMSWQAVQAMFAGVGSQLGQGLFMQYGPFNRNGEFTSESNMRFDTALRERDPEMGIRDDQALIGLAAEQGLMLKEDIGMPANNRILVWAK